MKQISLSVLVPVFNERYLVEESLGRLEVLGACPWIRRVQIIVVDDCSTDGSGEILRNFFRRKKGSRGKLRWEFLAHERNSGKGAAVRTALARAKEEVTIIHDADLEYHPEDIPDLLVPFLKEHADAVFGSRFRPKRYSRVLFYRHQLGNNLLTFLSNLVSNYNLTDMETCYKAVRTDLLKSIPLESDDFRLEVELTLKLAKRGARLFEAPISYSGRTYQEGKKINWKDGFKALESILRFGVSDNIFPEDPFGSRILARMHRAPRMNRWMADAIAPWVGRRVLEVGAGTGKVTETLVPRELYWATEVNPHYLSSLKLLTLSKPYLHVARCDVTQARDFPGSKGDFDTVLCLNVLEHLHDDSQVMKNFSTALEPGGRAILLVPQGAWAAGTLDRVLGYQKRYSVKELRAAAEKAGFDVEHISQFNRIGLLAWLINGKLLRRKHFGVVQIWCLNLCLPILRVIDPYLPWPGLALIMVARKQGNRRS